MKKRSRDGESGLIQPTRALALRQTALMVSVLLLAAAGVTVGQGLSSAQREQLSSVPRGLSSELLFQLRAVGARLQVPGKEETVLTGQLIEAGGNPKAVVVTQQISGMVRIDGVKDKVPITFDGDLSRGGGDRRDESLLETFVMDTIEGMVYSIRSGGAVRLLGRGFGPDPRVVPDYTGPRYDIYEVTAPVRSRQDRQLRLKRYYFDSASALLVSTQYTDPTFSSGISVETRFSEWRQVNGSSYPGRVDRYENGQIQFSFLVTDASSRPRQAAVNFR
jgi:hypothetical protein